MSTKSKSTSSKQAKPDESFHEVFTKKYDEFCDDLVGACPELKDKILRAKELTLNERIFHYKEHVLPTAGPMRDNKECPGFVLPGVEMTEEIWSQLSDKSKDAIQQYLTVLSFCCLYNMHRETMGDDNNMKDWSEKFLKDWKDKLGNIDFDTISKKLLETFTSGAGSFKMPEKFMKGHIARLAEEIVSEFKPEDFGLDAETLEKLEKEPSGAIGLLMNIYTNKPEVLQEAMKRIIKRLQQKFQRGEIRPDQIAAEAEELMKEFSGNDSFVELMETFRNTFGMADMDVAKKSNKEQDARRNIVRDRLRKKLDEKKNAKK